MQKFNADNVFNCILFLLYNVKYSSLLLISTNEKMLKVFSYPIKVEHGHKSMVKHVIAKLK